MQHAFITLVPKSNQQSVSIDDIKQLFIIIKQLLLKLVPKLITRIQIPLFLMKF